MLKPDDFATIALPAVRGVGELGEDAALTTEALGSKCCGMGGRVRQCGRRDFIDRWRAAGFEVDQLGIEHCGARPFRCPVLVESSAPYAARRRRSSI